MTTLGNIWTVELQSLLATLVNHSRMARLANSLFMCLCVYVFMCLQLQSKSRLVHTKIKRVAKTLDLCILMFIIRHTWLFSILPTSTADHVDIHCSASVQYFSTSAI